MSRKLDISTHRRLSRLYTLPRWLRWPLKLLCILLFVMLMVVFVPISAGYLLVYSVTNRNILMRMTTFISYTGWYLFLVMLYLTLPIKLRIERNIRHTKEKEQLSVQQGNTSQQLTNRKTVENKEEAMAFPSIDTGEHSLAEKRSVIEKFNPNCQTIDKFHTVHTPAEVNGTEIPDHHDIYNTVDGVTARRRSADGSVKNGKSLDNNDHLPIDATDIDLINMDRCLVLPNHYVSIDFLCHTLIALLYGCHKDLKYLLKESLIFLPVIGYGTWFLQFCFIKRNLVKDRNKIISYMDQMANNKYWLVLYSEGTRITPEKHRQSQSFCRGRNITPYENVLCPRTGGFLLMREKLLKQFSYVIDVTSYMYNQDKSHDTASEPYTHLPSFLSFLFWFPPNTLFINCLIRDIEEVSDEKFLENVFRRKDRLIHHWKTNGWHTNK